VHSATCLAFDPVQRLVAVGVDTGAKVLGAGGLEVLLHTPHHVGAALHVQFVPSTGGAAGCGLKGLRVQLPLIICRHRWAGSGGTGPSGAEVCTSSRQCGSPRIAGCWPV